MCLIYDSVGCVDLNFAQGSALISNSRFDGNSGGIANVLFTSHKFLLESSGGIFFGQLDYVIANGNMTVENCVFENNVVSKALNC